MGHRFAAASLGVPSSRTFATNATISVKVTGA
jgi:hypothetical protein